MNKSRIASLVVAVVALAGCAVPLAPGAEKVVLTRLPADVVGCTAVGNLASTEDGVSEDQARNQAIGLNGNKVLDTSPYVPFRWQPVLTAGVVYRCAD